LAGSEKGHAELSDAGHSVQPTRAVKMLMNAFEIKDGLQPESQQLRPQYSRQV